MTRSFQQAHHTRPALREGVQQAGCQPHPHPVTHAPEIGPNNMFLSCLSIQVTPHLPGWGASVSRTWQWEECEGSERSHKGQFSESVSRKRVSC